MVTLSNLSIYNYPNNIAGDPKPIFTWTQTGVPTLFEIQINFQVNSFTSPRVDTTFQSFNRQYQLSPEFALLIPASGGTYYARIRGYDGSWGAYSTPLQFIVNLLDPPPPVINPVNVLAKDFSQTITGIKKPNLYVYISNNGGPFLEASYPNGIGSTQWSYLLTLDSGENDIVAVTSTVESTNGAKSVEVGASIYLATIHPKKHNVWNAFDELGLLLGLQRNPGEKNVPYKSRLVDVYANPGNSTYNGLINGIARELGIQRSQVEINKLSDLMDPSFDGNLLNDDGNAIGTPLVEYAEEVYENNPVFLGTVISDQSYWDGVDKNTNGFVYLPHIWDASANGIPSKWQAGGVGDHDDLWVTGPLAVWNATNNDYNWYLQIHTGFFYSTNPWGLFGAPSGAIGVGPSGYYVEDDTGVLVYDNNNIRIRDDN